MYTVYYIKDSNEDKVHVSNIKDLVSIINIFETTENITKYKVCSDFGTMLKQSDFGWVGFNKWNIFLWDNT